MFLELKTNPKHIVIQRRTTNGKWENLASISTPSKMNYQDVKSLLDNYFYSEENKHDGEVRAVIIGKKSGRVIPFLSTKSYPFYDSVLGHPQSFFVFVNKKTKENIVFSNISFAPFKEIKDMKNFILENGGIADASMRKMCEEDGYLKVWDITLHSGEIYSVSILEGA